MKNSGKKSKSMKSITSFLEVTIITIIDIWRFVFWVIVVCTIGFMALLFFYDRKVLEEDEYKLLMNNLDLAGCQESRNELIKQVNSGQPVTNEGAARSRTKCDEERKQAAYKAQQKAIADEKK
jgi:hypothetical protein